MNRYLKYIVLLLIIWMEFIFHSKYINDFPSHTHAWAQADRYALALGFVDNDLNFFKPQNYILNHQFPDDWNTPTNVRNTVVDFPIHDYIPAITMKISGSRSPWIFRSYILLYGLIGLYFLYKLAFLLTGDFYKSVFAFLFAATSPVLVYYQDGFLPTIPSFANALIGIYFYVRYLKKDSLRDFRWSMVFLTLATLSRFTFAIPEIAVLGLEFLRILRKETKLLNKLLPVGISIACIAAYNIYNSYLRSLYGSDFLSSTLPAKNLQEVKEILDVVIERWGTQYFTGMHYWIFAILLLGVLIFYVSKLSRPSKLINQMWLLTGAILVGCCGFSLLMMQQYSYHDYYFLDTFFLPFSLVIVLCLAAIPEWKFRFYPLVALALIVTAGFFFTKKISWNQKQRRYTGALNTIQSTIENFKDSDEFLNSLNIGRDAKMLVFDPVGPQIPFIWMNRTGYILMWMNKGAMEQSLDWDFDYIVFQNASFISNVYSVFPEILTRLEKIGDNGKLIICHLKDQDSDQTLLSFLDLDKKNAVLSDEITFDVPHSVSWSQVDSTSEKAFSGSMSGVLLPEVEYGLSYHQDDLQNVLSKPRTLRFIGSFCGSLAGDLDLVVSLDSKGENYYYKSYRLNDFLQGTDQWRTADFLFQLPGTESGDCDFGIYLWNHNQNKIYIDDFGFSIY